MKQINTHDLRIAETLKSLSATPFPEPVHSSPRRARRFALGLSLTAIVAFTGLAAASWPAIVEHARKVFPDQTVAAAPAPERPVAASSEQTVAAGGTPPSAVVVPILAPREIAGSGYVVAPQTTAVFAKYGGALSRVLVDLGEWVEAGQIVAVLEDKRAHFALEQAQAALISENLALAAREIDLAQAQALLDRTHALAARGVATDLQVDDAKRALHVAKNAVAQGRLNITTADLAIRIAREPVEALTLRAPISGTVTELSATAGDTVLGRIDGQSLLTITNTDALFIDADVAEANIAMLRSGLQGEAVLDGFPDHPFTIALARIAPQISAAKGTVTIRLTLDTPPAGIRPNMAARIRIFATPLKTH